MFKEEIVNLISKATNLKKTEIGALLEAPPNEKLGDYAFPCFILAKKLKKNPAEIAKNIASKLKTAKDKKIEKIETKGPYINFFINKELMAEQIVKIDESYGREKGKKEKILLEHTSVNPNASPHVGRARNSIIGDSVKRLLEFSGHKVETHYYINDVSKQIAMLALVFKSGDFPDLLKKYVEITKRMEKNPELEKKVFQLLHKFEHKDKETVRKFKKIVDTAVKGQKKIFSSFGINFDYFDYESRYIQPGKKILKELEKTSKLFKDKEGRFILNQQHTGLESRMKFPVLVLTRQDETGLYPLRDLAYTIEKCKKARNIIILGEDQKLYFEQLKQALILLKRPYPEVIHYSFVLLKDIGKMSTRRGELVLLEEFIAEATKKANQEVKKRKTKGDAKKIGIGAIKYIMLRNDNNKNITFDWQQALNFEGDSGPYLQYSYARASSILKKAKKAKSKFKSTKTKSNKLSNQEIKLIKEIAKFPEIAKTAAHQLNPSLVANYSFQLAQTFNEFYHSCPVIGSEEESFRLKLVRAFRITIKNSLWLLGIEVMEEM